ncbi:MAG: hypothetical protein J6D23_06330 [Clostridia bacterium]|nr:hypothetical protein [Clostridia bacterium]
MKITEQNKELMKAFIRVLANTSVSRNASEMICSMMRSKAEMDKMIAYIRLNPQATEEQILNKAMEITQVY